MKNSLYKNNEDIFKRMLLIRVFERAVDSLFADGILRGTSHLAVGEEATAVGAAAGLSDLDYVSSNHRGHGHFIAKGGDPYKIMAELFGLPSGYSFGRGGTQHMADFSIGFLGMNGITGGMLAIATGAAFSIAYQRSDRVSLAFFGDGASNQGTFHESLNMASIWQLPVIYFCENNLYAMSSPARELVSVENIAERAKAYNIEGIIVDGNDPEAVKNAVTNAADKARGKGGPTLIEAKCYRTLGHSRGDLRVYRTREEEEEWTKLDAILTFKQKLIDTRELKEEECGALEQETENNISAIIDRCKSEAKTLGIM